MSSVGLLCVTDPERDLLCKLPRLLRPQLLLYLLRSYRRTIVNSLAPRYLQRRDSLRFSPIPRLKLMRFGIRADS